MNIRHRIKNIEEKIYIETNKKKQIEDKEFEHTQREKYFEEVIQDINRDIEEIIIKKQRLSQIIDDISSNIRGKMLFFTKEESIVYIEIYKKIVFEEIKEIYKDPKKISELVFFNKLEEMSMKEEKENTNIHKEMLIIIKQAEKELQDRMYKLMDILKLLFEKSRYWRELHRENARLEKKQEDLLLKITEKTELENGHRDPYNIEILNRRINNLNAILNIVFLFKNVYRIKAKRKDYLKSSNKSKLK